MSREIKFRCIHKNMLDIDSKTKIEGNRESMRLLYNKACESCDTSGAYIFMQYMGEKDMHGVEMWEGDTFRHGIIEGEIVFNNGCFTFQAEGVSMTLRDHSPNEFEITGNIYTKK